MKRTSLLVVLIFFIVKIYAQSLSGVVTDTENRPLGGVAVAVAGTHYATLTGTNGEFSFPKIKLGNYNLQFFCPGFEREELSVEITGNAENVSVEMSKLEIVTDEITIRAYRADNSTPVAYTNLSSEEISKFNFGQDVPYLLEMTPSVVANSDAGAGVGYTTLRIRGTDMTRINITLDGIPLNDPESHGVWWVDLPDYASSVDNIQIQRGAGSSTNGAAAFGANINFKTNALRKEAYTELNTSYGSFDTWKATAKFGTGLLNEHFTFDTRISKIHSDGYIDRASTDMESYFLSGAYTDKHNLLRINAFNGVEETYQAWYGVPQDSLENGRQYNPYSYDNEIDHYQQQHLQLFYTHEFNQSLNANLALHYTKGYGYYEQYKSERTLADYGLTDVQIGDSVITESDLIQRKWLDNQFYGMVYSFDYQLDKLHAVLGGGYNTYTGDHFGRVIWAQYASDGQIRHEWYRNQGNKSDLNTYLKLNYELGSSLNLWADLQYRIINYTIDGTEDDARALSQTHNYPFFNPKGGFSYTISGSQSAYASLSVANREPARTDLVEASESQMPQAETLYDYEAGYKLNTQNIGFNANLYYMDYRNQLVLTGEINDVGGMVSENVAKSYRTGIELALGVKITESINWNINYTYSQNKIENFTTYVDDWTTWGQVSETHEETAIAFSPNSIASSSLTFNVIKGFNVSLTSKYVSKQYIDNTQNEARTLDAYLVNNLLLNYVITTKKSNQIELKFSINNILDEKYETNAWVYRYYWDGGEYADYGYFPQAGRHVMAGLNFKF